MEALLGTHPLYLSPHSITEAAAQWDGTTPRRITARATEPDERKVPTLALGIQ